MPLPTRDADFVAYDVQGQPVLLVEVKSIHGTSGSWAARFRRNLLAHGRLPRAAFFLIATPERLYFWRQGNAGTEEEPPQFTMDTTAELKPYFERFDQAPDKTSAQALELILLAWLKDLGQLGRSGMKQGSDRLWLLESGLLDALRTARIELNPAQ